MYAVDPGIFAMNRGYHNDEEVERNHLEPIIDDGSGWRMAFRRHFSVASRTPLTISNDGCLAVEEPPYIHFSTRLELFPQHVFGSGPPVAWIALSCHGSEIE